MISSYLTTPGRRQPRSLRAALVSLLLLPLLLARGATTTALTAPTARMRAPATVAFALGGDIYVVRADGTGLRRLTSYGMNHAPQLSPHQRLVAYLSVPRGYTNAYGYALTHNIWLISIDGARATRLTPTNPHADRSAPVWSPDGRLLAYWEGTSIRLADAVTGATRLLTVLPWAAHAAAGLVWSPDSRRLAIDRDTWGMNIADKYAIQVTVVALDGSTTTRLIHFPHAQLGDIAHTSGSAPGGIVAWTADGHHFLLLTFWEGIGDSVSGIWQAPVEGGRARVLVGDPGNSARSDPGPLAGQSQVQLSPDGSYLATDPGDLWVASPDGRHGRLLHTNGCYLTQYRWLADSSGLAYICAQREPGTATPWRYTLSLWSIALGGGQPHLLLRRSHQDPQVLELNTPDFDRPTCTGPCGA